jgi:putative transposase
MNARTYTDAQILLILLEAEGGVPVAKLGRAHGMSSALFYQWQSKVGAQSMVGKTLHYGKGTCGGQVNGN